MNSVLITGAKRGLGLEFVKQYARDGWQVIATCRHPESAVDLQTLIKQYATISLYPLDTTLQTSIQDLQDRLTGVAIDVLINNAGIYGQGHSQLNHLDVADLQQVYLTNAIAPLQVTEALVSNVILSQLKIVVLISSIMGSISATSNGGAYAYRASKAAANMLMKTLACDVQGQGIRVLMLHPGWVRTAMGGAKAPLMPQESVKGMRNVIANLKMDETGIFYDYQGAKIAW